MSKDKTIDCEWCGMSYPEDPNKEGHPIGYEFRTVRVRDTRVAVFKPEFSEHTICKDCYDHLKVI